MQSDALYSLAVNPLMSMAAASVVVWTYWGTAATPLLLGWLALDVTHALLLLSTGLLSKRPNKPNLDPQQWRSIYVMLMAFGGLVWGISGLLLLPSGSPEHALVIGLVAMGAVLATYPTVLYPPAFLAFQLPVFFLCAIGYAYSDLAYGAVVAGLAVAVSLSLVEIGKQMGDRLTGAMRLVIENAEMMRVQTEQSVALAHANKELARLTGIDPLTGLANRRRLVEALRSEGREIGATLLYIDVDHFKQYNDTYGHGAGDECLIAVGNVLARYADKYEGLAARQGGEEFSLLFAKVRADQAAEIAEALRGEIQNMQCAGASNARAVTVSIGYAHRAPRMNDDQFMDLADAAAYRAKRGGRNRVCGPEDSGQTETEAFRQAIA